MGSGARGCVLGGGALASFCFEGSTLQEEGFQERRDVSPQRSLSSVGAKADADAVLAATARDVKAVADAQSRLVRVIEEWVRSKLPEGVRGTIAHTWSWDLGMLFLSGLSVSLWASLRRAAPHQQCPASRPQDVSQELTQRLAVHDTRIQELQSALHEVSSRLASFPR